MSRLRVALGIVLFATGCAEAPQTGIATPASAVAEVSKTEKPTPAPPMEPSKGALAPPLAKVLEEAVAAGTPPLLYFSTVWCGPCATIEKSVMPDLNVTSILHSYRFQKYDAEIGEGALLAAKMGVTSYPTLIFLSMKGDEVSRMTAPQQPDSFTEALKSKLVLAKAADEAADPSNPRRIYQSAQVEEAKTEPGAKDRARKLYLQASTLAKKQKLIDVVADADFAVAQLDTRSRERREHAAVLIDFAKRHPASPRTVDAIEGLVPLAAEAKLSDVKKAAPAIIAAHSGLDLRRLAVALKKVGDEGDGKRAEDLANKEAAPMSAPDSRIPDAMRFVDPLVVRFSFGGMPGGVKLPPEQQAKVLFPMHAARQLVEDCRQLPRVGETIGVRIYPASGSVTRAVVLDPEASPELKVCLEKSAVGIKNVPAEMSERMDLHVVFQVSTGKH